MENYRFESFRDWYTFLWGACKVFGKGIWQITYAFVGGVVSLLIYSARQIEKFCCREPLASGIIGVAFVILIVGWISTFMNGRVAVMTAEHQRDSIGYVLDKYMQAFDSASTIIVDNDTIRHGTKDIHP